MCDKKVLELKRKVSGIVLRKSLKRKGLAISQRLSLMKMNLYLSTLYIDRKANPLNWTNVDSLFFLS